MQNLCDAFFVIYFFGVACGRAFRCNLFREKLKRISAAIPNAEHPDFKLLFLILKTFFLKYKRLEALLKKNIARGYAQRGKFQIHLTS